jgi:hypothetical protein
LLRRLIQESKFYASEGCGLEITKELFIVASLAATSAKIVSSCGPDLLLRDSYGFDLVLPGWCAGTEGWGRKMRDGKLCL